jgi:adenylylsulfate kinase-like enzyme
MGNEDMAVRVLVVTGPVGVGKSAVADELARLLEEMRLPCAVIDMDWLRYCYPRPEGDRFHTALGLQNLAAISANYRAAGANRLIVVDIVETRSSIGAYRAAIPDASILVVRLDATLPIIHRRLEGRETGASLEWHQHRAAELSAQWEEEAVEDLLVDTEGKTVTDVASEVLARTGWAGPEA